MAHSYTFDMVVFGTVLITEKIYATRLMGNNNRVGSPINNHRLNNLLFLLNHCYFIRIIDHL